MITPINMYLAIRRVAGGPPWAAWHLATRYVNNTLTAREWNLIEEFFLP